MAVPLQDSGYFALAAKPGAWTLRATLLATGETRERQVVVGQAPVRVSAIVLADHALPAKGSAPVVDFEDVTKLVIVKLPAGIAGLNWANLIAVDNEMYGGQGYINNTVSGNYVAYNTSGYPVTIWHESGFDFHGAYFGVAWLEAEGEVLEVRAWRKDQLVGEEARCRPWSPSALMPPTTTSRGWSWQRAVTGNS